MGRRSITLIFPALMVLFLFQALHAQEKAEGRKLYLIYCLGCHGESGRGDGPGAGSLAIKPANHTDGARMNQLSDKHLLDIITKGGSAVGKSSFMPAWGSQLKEKQVRDLISYIRSLAVPRYNPPDK